jgi:predicted PurR-regulated permease PerM
MSGILINLIVWLITVLIGGALIYFAKKYLDNLSHCNNQNTTSINLLVSRVDVLVQKLTDQQERSEASEKIASHRLDAHAESISGLKTKVTEHDTLIKEHGRRIELVENKAS